jgi:hypothetical protein
VRVRGISFRGRDQRAKGQFYSLRNLQVVSRKHSTDFTTELDQSGENIYEVSGEALEAAAGTYIGVLLTRRARPLLCTLRDRCRQRPRNTRYQADATPYSGRTYTGWIAPACGWRTYSITSSASISILSGMLRLSVLTVLRLITSSYSVGCSMGSSPGLAPLSILSTKVAERRIMSAMFGP